MAWGRGVPCPKQRPSLLQKRDQHKADLALEKKIRAAVKKRDGYWCRVCLALREPGDVATHYGYRGSELHHIVPRSLGGKHSTHNCIWVCADHHRERHAGVIRITGNGDGAIQVERIWT